jgi:hypothetical protein
MALSSHLAKAVPFVRGQRRASRRSSGRSMIDDVNSGALDADELRGFLKVAP